MERAEAEKRIAAERAEAEKRSMANMHIFERLKLQYEVRSNVGGSLRSRASSRASSRPSEPTQAFAPGRMEI